MIDYRIHTFLAVCKEMNYTKASEILNITQPNVTQHIRWLEEHYGQKLFEYKKRKLSLTPAGEILRDAAVAMVHEERLLARRMALAGSEPERFSFGITRSINEGGMKEKVMSLLKEYAGYSLQFCVDNTKNLLAKLDDMTLDFAVVEGNFDKKRYDYIVLSGENFIPVCGRNYPLPEGKRRLEDLCGLRLIIREAGSGSREILESILKSRNLSCDNFDKVMEIGDIKAIKMLLKEGHGLTFIYETAVRRELERGELVKIPLEDLNIRHDFSMIWLKTSHFRSIYEKLAERLKTDENRQIAE